MSLGQLLVLALIVAVVWMGSKLKKQEGRLGELEDRSKDSGEK